MGGGATAKYAPVKQVATASGPAPAPRLVVASGPAVAVPQRHPETSALALHPDPGALDVHHTAIHVDVAPSHAQRLPQAQTRGEDAFREIRAGTDFDWVKPDTYRKTVATLLDGSGATARMIADQLGNSRVWMTQDVYLGRRLVDPSVAQALEGFRPRRGTDARSSGGGVTLSCFASCSAFAPRITAVVAALTCVFVGPVGLEPTTYGLKVRSSAN
jgi:hypothetical protein